MFKAVTALKLSGDMTDRHTDGHSLLYFMITSTSDLYLIFIYYSNIFPYFIFDHFETKPIKFKEIYSVKYYLQNFHLLNHNL